MIIIQTRLTVRVGGGGCIHSEWPAMPTTSPQGGLLSCGRIREQEFTTNPKVKEESEKAGLNSTFRKLRAEKKRKQ